MRSWLAAARPRTLLAAVAPVLVGSGLAIGDGVFHAGIGAVTLATAVLLNIAANLANDVSDARSGADGDDRIGPPRVVASGLLTARQVWTATAITIALAAAGGVYLALQAGWVVIAIGAAAVAALLGYTGKPIRYGYRGFGEIAVFVFFGPAAVVGSRFVHDASAPAAAWALAVPVGLLATAILVANNVRDIDSDHRAGKRTLAVRLGRPRTRVFYAVLVGGAFAVIAVTAGVGVVPPWCLLALAAAPLAARPLRLVFTQVDGQPLIAALVATAALHGATGALLGIGASIS